MKRALLAAAALVASSMASAVVVTIDNFDSPNVGPLSAALGATANFSSAPAASGRTGSITTLAGAADGNGAIMKIGSGTFPVGLLEVSNTSGHDSEVRLNWTIAAGLLPAAAINIGFFMQVVESDGNPTSLEFLLNGTSLTTRDIAPNTKNTGVSFGLTAAQVASLSSGGSLGLRINGATGWDLTIDQFGFSYDLPSSSVPEPTSLALAGLALAAAGAARRRKA